MKRPNIVFVLTDDQGYGDLGCHGNDIIKTPCIDDFYNESVRLEDYHVGPTCAPTRAGLMTGHYANSTGVWHTIGGRSLLRQDEWTIADALKENGYETGIFGKWHLGDTYPYRPSDRGFNKSIIHKGGGVGQTPDYWGNDYFDDTYYDNNQPKKFSGYCTDVFYNEAMKFIEEKKDEPFFCYIACNAPHEPYNVPKEYEDIYKDADINEDRKKFYGMISNIDENFGKLVNKLEELDVIDDTILIFMTDNGSSGGSVLDENEQVIDGYNGGFRGLKGSEYEGGHHVPFFIRYPRLGIQGGKDIEELTANVDFMPTILDLCDIEIPKDREVDGVSLKDLLTGETNTLEARYVVTDSQRVTNPIKWKQSSVMKGKWRLINGTELYNIKNDRSQKVDVSSLYKNKVDKMREAYDIWWDKVTGNVEQDVPILFGDNDCILTTHDTRGEGDDCAWNQGEIRAGKRTSSYWEVEIEKDGTYQMEICRWPISHRRNICEGIDGDDILYNKEEIHYKYENWYTGGTSIDIEKVVIDIDEKQYELNVNKDDSSIITNIDLNKGKTKAYVHFIDRSGRHYAAYYVYVRRLDN